MRLHAQSWGYFLTWFSLPVSCLGPHTHAACILSSSLTHDGIIHMNVKPTLSNRNEASRDNRSCAACEVVSMLTLVHMWARRTRADAEKALSQMSGTMLGSRRIRCGWAQHKQENSQANYAAVDRVLPLPFVAPQHAASHSILCCGSSEIQLVGRLRSPIADVFSSLRC